MGRPACTRETLELMKLRKALPPRIVAFMKRYSLNNAGFALIVRTAQQTVGGWLNGKSIAPAPIVALMELLEQSEECRQLLGVYRYRTKRKSALVRTKPIPEKTLQKSRERAERNLLAKSEDYFDVELFLEGPVNFPDVVHPEYKDK
jgi:hypothetical protein